MRALFVVAAFGLVCSDAGAQQVVAPDVFGSFARGYESGQRSAMMRDAQREQQERSALAAAQREACAATREAALGAAIARYNALLPATAPDQQQQLYSSYMSERAAAFQVFSSCLTAIQY